MIEKFKVAMNGELAHQINVGLLDRLPPSPSTHTPESLNLISWNQL